LQKPKKNKANPWELRAMGGAKGGDYLEKKSGMRGGAKERRLSWRKRVQYCF